MKVYEGVRNILNKFLPSLWAWPAAGLVRFGGRRLRFIVKGSKVLIGFIGFKPFEPLEAYERCASFKLFEPFEPYDSRWTLRTSLKS